MNERKAYIDVVRGILILLVVLFHTPFVLRSAGCIGEVPFFDAFSGFYVVFFMPGFFFLTGYCTNWGGVILTFLQRFVKRTILPALVLPIFASLLYFDKAVFANFLDFDSWTYSCVGWFICALAVAKSLYFCIRRLVKNGVLLFVVVLTIAVLGFVLNKFFELPNHGFYQNGMILMFFVYLGDKARNFSFSTEKISKYLGVGYVLVWLACSILGFSLPNVMLSVNCSYLKFVPYFIIATMGICLLVSFSKWINTSRFFEYMGRHSLVIYFFHSVLIFQIGRLFDGICLCDNLMVLLVFVVVVALASFIAWLFDLPYLRWLVGRF